MFKSSIIDDVKQRLFPVEKNVMSYAWIITILVIIMNILLVICIAVRNCQNLAKFGKTIPGSLIWITIVFVVSYSFSKIVPDLTSFPEYVLPNKEKLENKIKLRFSRSWSVLILVVNGPLVFLYISVMRDIWPIITLGRSHLTNNFIRVAGIESFGLALIFYLFDLVQSYIFFILMSIIFYKLTKYSLITAEAMKDIDKVNIFHDDGYLGFRETETFLNRVKKYLYLISYLVTIFYFVVYFFSGDLFLVNFAIPTSIFLLIGFATFYYYPQNEMYKRITNERDDRYRQTNKALFQLEDDIQKASTSQGSSSLETKLNIFKMYRDIIDSNIDWLRKPIQFAAIGKSALSIFLPVIASIVIENYMSK